MDTLPSFDLTTEQIETSIKQVIADNRFLFNQLLSQENPSIEEVLDSLDGMDSKLGEVCSGIQHLLNVYPTQTVFEGYMAMSTELAHYVNEVTQNSWLISALVNAQESSLSFEQKALLKQYQNMLKLAGVLLTEKDKLVFDEVQNQLNQSLTLFEQNIQQSYQEVKCNNSFTTILDENKIQYIMNYEANRDVRKKAYEIYYNRASANIIENNQLDNGSVIVNICNNRLKIAKLLGYGSYWNLSLSSKSLKSTEKILDFIDQVLQQCLPKCQSIIRTICDSLNIDYEVQPWDVDYLLQQYISKYLQLNMQDVAAYYPINAVIGGVSQLINRLFGIALEQIEDANAWHPDVIVFKAVENGQVLGYIYADLFTREHKNNQFSWVDIMQARKKITHDNYQLPIIFLTCNFDAPVGGAPCLLTQDNLIRLLHEFGHAIHHLVSESPYANLAGTNGVAIDEVEIPSLFFENFAWEKSFIDLFAKHYQTGEMMSDSLFQNLKAAYQLILPIKLMRRVKMALFDIRVHCLLQEISMQEVTKIAQEVHQLTNFLPTMSNDTEWYKSASLIFTSQYAAGYYSYLWAEMIGADFFYCIYKDDMLNPKQSQNFRKQVLAPGGSFELNLAYEAICKRSMSMATFFKNRNII